MTDVITPVAVEMGDRWISVSTCLPEPLHDVLVTYRLGDDEPTVDIAFRKPDGHWVITGSELTIHPTDWMPLPAPREER